MKKRVSIICAAALIAGGIFVAAAVDTPQQSGSFTLYSDQAVITMNDIDIPTESEPIVYKNSLYIPIDNILKACGFSMGYDASIPAIIAVKDNVTSYIIPETNVIWIGEEQVEFPTPSLIYKGVAYISLEMFSRMCDYSVYMTGTAREIPLDKRDLLEDTYITDDYRLPYYNVATYNGITIVNGIGMERLVVPSLQATYYAGVVNAVADALPNVNVYNIAVPTASEFYAPKQIATDQTSGIRTIYQNLNENVMPINVVKPLMEHAGEKIYFNTDHHWTQRGAYYAYKAFADNKGFNIDPLETFETNNYYSHIGSFASFTSGTAGASIIRSNPELLERFIPKVETTGAAYSDMYMQRYLYSLRAVDTRSTTYSAFIGGDNPLAVFHTSVANGKSLVIIKESFGTAFATWAMNNYENVYVIDPRRFNGFGGNYADFDLRTFYNLVHFDDLVIINYPGSISSSGIRQSILNMVK